MKTPYIIGISGGSASGKTSIIRDLMNSKFIKSLALVSQDNYYLSREKQFIDENGIINFDLPTAIDYACFIKDLQALQSGKSISKREYVFNNELATPKEITVDSAPIIIVEGLFIFHFEQIRHILNYKVFVDATEEVRLQRRIQRDQIERNYSKSDVHYRWKHHVQPAHEKFLQSYKSHCDLVIDSNESYHRDFYTLENHIKHILAS